MPKDAVLGEYCVFFAVGIVSAISTINKNLEDEITNGNFREDLFCRLNVFKIFLDSTERIIGYKLRKYEINKKRFR